MGFQELRQKIADKIKEKNAEYNQAQEESLARDDYETTDKALRNKRREVRKYMDKDEKTKLEAYIRARQAAEDRSWMNPYGMLDNQEINIAKNYTNVFTNSLNPYKDTVNSPVNILKAPNLIRGKSITKKKRNRTRK